MNDSENSSASASANTPGAEAASWAGRAAAKDWAAPSVFRPENLLREARRQKRLPDAPVPEICLLDPDGDVVRQLRRAGRARASPGWACYHTTLDEFDAGPGHPNSGQADPERPVPERLGVVGCAVGAPFAVLVAEQLFASGCRFLVSITSAGQITPAGPPPYFVLIDQALRDEGTSGHYLPPGDPAAADPRLADAAYAALLAAPVPVRRGLAWTTDAPFRETERAIAAARAAGALAVEMEAAALYAFARARSCPVLCFAHVTNQMAVAGDDFDKGADDGAHDAITVAATAARAWRSLGRSLGRALTQPMQEG